MVSAVRFRINRQDLQAYYTKALIYPDMTIKTYSMPMTKAVDIQSL